MTQAHPVQPAAQSSATPPEKPSVYDGYALSLRQPWATLLVHGKKTIEVRRWPTLRRGRILIHAAKIADARPEAWTFVPEELKECAALTGGIIGVGELRECVEYRTITEFARDQGMHFNHLSWFQSPVLYGFTFANLAPLPFRRCSGWMRFFPVTIGPGKRRGIRGEGRGK